MAELKKIYMVSYYEGKPTVGISPKSGNLTISESEIRFDVEMGTSLMNWSVVGMISARKKAREEAAVISYRYNDMQSVSSEKYMGMMPMITLTMKDGKMHSFAGLMNADECVDLIQRQIRKWNFNTSASTSNQVPSGKKENSPVITPENNTSSFSKPVEKPSYTEQVRKNDEKLLPKVEEFSSDPKEEKNFSSHHDKPVNATPVSNFLTKMTEKTGENKEKHVQKRIVCAKCGYVYESDDFFCPECNSIETIETK